MFNLALPVAGVLVALLIGAVMLLSPEGRSDRGLRGAGQRRCRQRFGITQSLVKATPLLLVGLGICIAFRANVINIGGEGQIIAGRLMATWFPLTFRTWPGWFLIPRR